MAGRGSTRIRGGFHSTFFENLEWGHGLPVFRSTRIQTRGLRRGGADYPTQMGELINGNQPAEKYLQVKFNPEANNSGSSSHEVMSRVEQLCPDLNTGLGSGGFSKSVVFERA